jgi:CRISPR/Cas system-associated exonuclease Cas4 (RecB family)
MKLTDDFQLSQGSLQDFAECRRRFYLRYIQRLAWPAVQSEPVLEFEHYMQQGEQFHRMVQQHQLGLPLERLTPMAQGDDLSRWWLSYLTHSRENGSLETLVGDDSRRYAEISLSFPLGSVRLVAKYDLLSVSPQGRAVIFDWKTARKRPRRQWLAAHLQTRVYPYLLVQAGAYLNQGRPFEPEQVEMVYWFANFPEQPERFPYSVAAFNSDGEYLAELVSGIQRLEEQDFTLTPDLRRCAFCVYRSLCERGDKAGMLAEYELEIETGEGFALELDFEQIQEIEF